jgi:hypothetical protein
LNKSHSPMEIRVRRLCQIDTPIFPCNQH